MAPDNPLGWSALAGLAASALTYFGTRYVARRQADTADEKAEIEARDSIFKGYGSLNEMQAKRLQEAYHDHAACIVENRRLRDERDQYAAENASLRLRLLMYEPIDKPTPPTEDIG